MVGEIPMFALDKPIIDYHYKFMYDLEKGVREGVITEDQIPYLHFVWDCPPITCPFQQSTKSSTELAGLQSNYDVISQVQGIIDLGNKQLVVDSRNTEAFNAVKKLKEEYDEYPLLNEDLWSKYKSELPPDDGDDPMELDYVEDLRDSIKDSSRL